MIGSLHRIIDVNKKLAHVQDAVDDLHELARNSANVDHKKWPGPVLDLYLGATSPETFSATSLSNMDAKVRPKRACEVAFYLGTFYLERHDRNEAKRHLEAAVNACPPNLVDARGDGYEEGCARVRLCRDAWKPPFCCCNMLTIEDGSSISILSPKQNASVTKQGLSGLPPDPTAFGWQDRRISRGRSPASSLPTPRA